jgi:diguanylate cyclase (GGDEF)-like protein
VDDGPDPGTVTPPAGGSDTPATGDGTNPPDSSEAGTPPRSTGTLTEDNGTKGDSTSNNSTEGVADSETVPAAAAGGASVTALNSASSSDVDRAARSAADQIAENAESGVVASLVVTQVINKIPSWVLWALAALAAIALVGLALFWRERRRRRSAEEDAMVDELTGISNRKAFDRRLDLEWRRAARYGRSLGLMVMDLDGFKQVNDIEGHAAGDRVLRAVAQSIDKRMRDTDLVARIGGDEFAVICPETGINELMSIRRQLGEQATGGLEESVGLSIGVAEYVPGDEDATSILARADESMYRVKRGEALGVPA